MKIRVNITNWGRTITNTGHVLVGTVTTPDGDSAEHTSTGLIRFEPEINQAESWDTVYNLGTHAKKADDK